MSFWLIAQLARLIIAVAIGLFGVGYLAARACRSSAPALLAFPLSLVILFHCVFMVGLLGIAITFGHVLVPLLVIAALLIYFCPGPIAKFKSDPSKKPSMQRIGIALAAISAALMIQQALLTPLSGYDTVFRWNLLALRVLQLHTFSFYPPIHPADFQHYFYIDSFPPVVSFAYWWVYAAWGSYVPQLSALVVVPQYLVILCFTYCLASKMAGSALGSTAGGLAVTILATSSAYFRDQAIGQETALMAVALMAVLWIVLTQSADKSTMILAGACAALGALCREYGGAYIAFGLFLVLAKYRSLKLTGIFFLSALCCSAGWYLRNIALTGNPFFSLNFLGLPGNAMFMDMLKSFPPHFGMGAWDARRWHNMITYLLMGSPMQLTAGLAALIFMPRKNLWLTATLIMVVALWVDSAGHSAGGEQYSSRNLAPAWAILSVAAAVWLSRWPSPRWQIACIAVLICFGVAFISDWIFPFSFFNPPTGSWLASGWHYHQRDDIEEEMVPIVQQLLPPHARILGDELAGYWLLDRAGHQLVPPWSPEVAFLFDPTVSAEQACQRMHQIHIDYVLAVPGGAFTFYFWDHSRFYQGSNRWEKIAQTRGLILFHIPAEELGAAHRR